MNTRTITAMFDSAEAAHRARQRLLDLGLASDDVQVIGQDASDERAADHKGMWESIKDFFTGEGDDGATYEEGMRRGGQLLTARVQDENADGVLAVLDDSDAVDLDQRAQEWRSAGWTGTATTGAGAFEPMASAEVSQRAETSEIQDTEVTEEVVVGNFEGQRTAGVSDTVRRIGPQVEDARDEDEARDDTLVPRDSDRERVGR
jgi:hypothetical protein